MLLGYLERRFEANPRAVQVVLAVGQLDSTFKSANFGHPDVFVMFQNRHCHLLYDRMRRFPLLIVYVYLREQCEPDRVRHDDAFVYEITNTVAHLVAARVEISLLSHRPTVEHFPPGGVDWGAKFFRQCQPFSN
jgi:hypothetical protein